MLENKSASSKFNSNSTAQECKNASSLSLVLAALSLYKTFSLTRLAHLEFLKFVDCTEVQTKIELGANKQLCVCKNAHHLVSQVVADGIGLLGFIVSIHS